MKRRPQIDLVGQTKNSECVGKIASRMLRKRQRWTERNRDRPPEENPFLDAIKPVDERFGCQDESAADLRQRLSNLEFGNFPGYFNYRNKAVISGSLDHKVDTDGPKGEDVKGANIDNDEDTLADKRPPVCQQQHQNSSSKTDQCPSDAGYKLLGEAGTSETQETVSEGLDAGLSDSRLKFMRREWFEGRQVLDIGCNRGHITYAVARLFSPHSIVGIDIDLKMINMANRDLHLHLEDGIINKFRLSRQQREKSARLGDQTDGSSAAPVHHQCKSLFPLSCYVTQGPLTSCSLVDGSPAGTPRATDSSKSGNSEFATEELRARQSQQSKGSAVLPETSSFPNNIIFVEHNYVLARDELVDHQMAHFDTILCLSVTKWVHLNYRDEGLRRFLRRMYRHLRPEGLLILEAHPFDNYSKRKKLNGRLRANYNSLRFLPEHFDEYLLGPQVGFRRIIFNSLTEHKFRGFQRPLKVYLK